MSTAGRNPRRRSAPVGSRPDYSPMDAGLAVYAGDVRPLLRILAGEENLLAGLEWQDDALCGEVGEALFFPEKGGAGSSSHAARSVCAGCQVRRECLTDALEHMGDYGTGQHGIWGGTSHDQREWLLKAFPGDVRAACDYAMEQDCAIDTTDMQPRKSAAA